MKRTHLLTVAWLTILSFSAMDEGGVFIIKTMQTIGVFVDEGIVLRNKLPADLGRNNTVVSSRSSGRRSSC